MSFRDKARRRLQERAQPAEPADDQAPQKDPADEPEADSGSPEPAYAGELEELSKLKDDGILTEDEFAAKKKQILGI